MNQPVKLLLDECLGHPVAPEISSLLARDTPPPLIHHLFNYFKSGETDDVWIPKIADEGWIILTADRGKKGRVKLPNVCVAYKGTHILMSASVMRMKQYQKAAGIIALREKIKECNNASRGSRFLMEVDTYKRFVLRRVL